MSLKETTARPFSNDETITGRNGHHPPGQTASPQIRIEPHMALPPVVSFEVRVYGCAVPDTEITLKDGRRLYTFSACLKNGAIPALLFLVCEATDSTGPARNNAERCLGLMPPDLARHNIEAGEILNLCAPLPAHDGKMG